MAIYRLKLQKSELQNVSYRWLTAFRLRVEASDADNLGTDPNVFLFLRHPYNPHSQTYSDEYYGVCSPVDMSFYPVGEPTANTPYPFFRASVFEIDLSAQSYFDTVWQETVREVRHLLTALKRMEDLVPTEEVFVGDDVPASSESNSGSESGSVSG